MSKNKNIILDPCCGGKMFWFDKGDKRVLFTDIRKEEKGFLTVRPNFSVQPDLQMDFRDLKFAPNTFKMVVFDPPHLTRGGKDSWMRAKYGVLGATWRKDLAKGFSECWRVLEPGGVLIFKWNEYSIKIGEVLKLFAEPPLFGHTTGRSGTTKWVCWIKL